ncbi:MAG: hypothetical protein JXB00_17940 [Bacteroidales bacterium]|nr:hypothetical protein [Bacteroidales bacterium]
MQKKTITIFLILTISVTLAYSQEERSPLAVSWYPQLVFIRGLRADVDIHLGNSSSWIIFSPQYFLAERQSGGYENEYEDYNSSYQYNKLNGYGAELSHRIYINNKLTPTGIYFSYGILYNHFELKYKDDWGYIDYMGLSAISYGEYEHTTVIDKAGPSILIGYQKKVLDKIFIDVFFGGGMRYSFIETSSLAPRNFDNDIFQYGFTGTVPLAGFRIGIIL